MADVQTGGRGEMRSAKRDRRRKEGSAFKDAIVFAIPPPN